MGSCDGHEAPLCSVVRPVLANKHADIPLAPRSQYHPQSMHVQQVEDRKALVAACGQIDDMYDSLAAHEQKVKGRRPGSIDL